MNQAYDAIEVPEIGTFKGNTVLKLPNGDYSPFSFGVRKAKIILMNIGEIENFVQEEDPNCSTLDGI